MIGASVSRGAHSGFAGAVCSEEDELPPSAGLTGEGDDGGTVVEDSFSFAGDP